LVEEIRGRTPAGTLDVPLRQVRAGVTGPGPVTRRLFAIDTRGTSRPIRGLPATGGAGFEAPVSTLAILPRLGLAFHELLQGVPMLGHFALEGRRSLIHAGEELPHDRLVLIAVYHCPLLSIPTSYVRSRVIPVVAGFTAGEPPGSAFTPPIAPSPEAWEACSAWAVSAPSASQISGLQAAASAGSTSCGSAPEVSSSTTGASSRDCPSPLSVGVLPSP